MRDRWWNEWILESKDFQDTDSHVASERGRCTTGPQCEEGMIVFSDLEYEDGQEYGEKSTQEDEADPQNNRVLVG